MFKLSISRDPENLWKRYVVALAIILAFISASHLIESNAINQAKQHAETINLSAKQRMLSQQIILQAQEYITDRDPAVADDLAQTVDRFEKAHITLMEDATGEKSIGQIYLSRTPSTDELVQNYISIARSIPDSDYPVAQLEHLKELGSGEVLGRLDEAVSAFEARVQRQANWAHQLQQITMMVAAIMVILEALLIFLPAHRLVSKTVRELTVAAETDPLTKLRNRAGFDEDIKTAMQTREKTQSALTLILFDLDDFKGINDRYGHITGDAVLRRIGHRVSRLPELVSAARVGGDEFAILVDTQHWNADARLADIANDIASARDFIYRPINYKGRVIEISGSVGVSRYPVDADSLADLRRNASASLLDAKRTGRGSLSVYNNRIKEQVLRRRTIQSALLSGEYKRTLSVNYQPIIDIHTNQICSVEILARWKHADLGNVNPVEFLTIARESGLGQDVEQAVRQLAFTEMSEVLNKGRLDSLSLNVSPVDLAATDFADAFIRQLSEFGVRHEQVWIEVTETERLSSMNIARQNLEALSAAGIRIALDDYGVGYSNIHRLAELPIHRVKVDKSIVQNIEAGSKYAGVFRSSVQLARALGAEVVAEGVETQVQLKEVERYGCQYVQGYYYFKPMPASKCLDLLNGRESFVA